MNYKRIILSGIFLFIAIQINLVTVSAQEVATKASTPSTVTYQLPYPGLLPDSPLYLLKVIRDNITAFFISKPLDKAGFALLRSDKDVEASYLLVTKEQGKAQLAMQTFAQSQNLFEEAVKKTADAKKQGYSIKEISKKLALANQKHVQMLQAVGRQVHLEHSSTYKQELERAQTLAEMVKAL